MNVNNHNDLRKKIDITIKTVCDYIKQQVKSEKPNNEINIAENVNALASLIEARARF